MRLLKSLLILLFCPLWSNGQVIEGEQIYHVLPRDAIEAIFNPEFISNAEGAQVMKADEQVIGLVGPAGTAVAYSTWYLDEHEIVDDVVDGIPLAVTW